MQKNLEALLRMARDDSDVLAVILFGSEARGEATPLSDTDVCLVLTDERRLPLALSEKKLEYLALGGLDVAILQQLPLYIRRRVLREGRVVLAKDEDRLYELAFRTAQAFEDFRHRHEDYLRVVARARS